MLFTNIIPLHLFAYYSSVARGFNPVEIFDTSLLARKAGNFPARHSLELVRI